MNVDDGGVSVVAVGGVVDADVHEVDALRGSLLVKSVVLRKDGVCIHWRSRCGGSRIRGSSGTYDAAAVAAAVADWKNCPDHQGYATLKKEFKRILIRTKKVKSVQKADTYFISSLF